jgi:hypothetical protein
MKYALVTALFLSAFSFADAQTFNRKSNQFKLDYTGAPKNTVLPVVAWTKPAREFSNSQNNDIEIEATIRSSEPLKEAALVIIDSAKKENRKKLPLTPGSMQFDVNQKLYLPDGQYTIKLVAVNEKLGEVSSSRSIIVGKDALADALSIDRKDYVLLIATDKYDYWSDLVNPVEDATAIAGILKENYGFEVEILENPNHEDVFVKLADYLQKSYKPQDQLMIFFAGHGYFDDTFGEGFVVAKNSLENDVSKTSYISHARLRTVIENIPCDHVFLAMDVCFGGTFDPVIARSRGSEYADQTNDEYLVRKLSYKTRKYLTSGGKTYVSDGIAGKHSPFASKFIQALNESGGSDRILTLPELRTYVEKLTPEPRTGSFGTDEPASDFLFVAKP